MNESCRHKINLFSFFGGLFGSVLAYWLINDRTEFNSLFLTITDQADTSKDHYDFKYMMSVSHLQLEIGLAMIIISTIAITNTILRFRDVTKGERKTFS